MQRERACERRVGWRVLALRRIRETRLRPEHVEMGVPGTCRQADARLRRLRQRPEAIANGVALGGYVHTENTGVFRSLNASRAHSSAFTPRSSSTDAARTRWTDGSSAGGSMPCSSSRATRASMRRAIAIGLSVLTRCSLE